jgi:hypothetical protein
MKLFRRSLANSIATGILILLFGLTVVASDSRAQFGDTAATATEQMVAILYPRSRVEWRDAAWLVFDKTPARELFFPGFLQRPDGAGFLFATGVELAEQRRAAVQMLRGHRGSSRGGAVTRLAVFRSDRSGNVLEHTAGVLEAGGYQTQCLDIQVLPVEASQWPHLRVRYRSFHERFGSTTVIEWTSIVDATSMNVIERLPVRMLTQAGDDLPTVRTLTMRRIDERSLEVVATEGGRRLVYPCEARCIVREEVILSHDWQ